MNEKKKQTKKPKKNNEHEKKKKTSLNKFFLKIPKISSKQILGWMKRRLFRQIYKVWILKVRIWGEEERKKIIESITVKRTPPQKKSQTLDWIFWGK